MIPPALAMAVREGAAAVMPDRAWVAAVVFLPLMAAGIALDMAWVLQGFLRPDRWRRGARRLALRPWTSADAFALGIAVPLVLVVVGSLSAGMASVSAVLIQGTALAGIVLGYAFVAMRRRSVSPRRGFGLHRARLGRDVCAGLAAYVAAFPWVAISAIAGQAVLRRFGVATDPQPVLVLVAGDHAAWVRAVLVLLVVVAAPLAEEVLFRGIGQVAVARQWGSPAAVLGVSLLFAALHGHVPTFAPLFVIGLAFSLAYLRTGSLVTVITMHAVFNGVTLAVQFMAG